MKFRREVQSKGDRLGGIITAGLLTAIFFTALAHGAVEPWSIVLYELIVVALVTLWGIKIIRDRRFNITVPQVALPLAALIGIGLLQSIALNSGEYRQSLSLDVEATRRTVIVLIFLFITFVIAASFFESRRRLSMLAGFLVAFGLVLAIFGLVQNFTWNGKLYWIRPNTVSLSPFGPFVNHNHFAGYMELLIPLPIALIITRAVRGETRLLYGFAAAVMGTALVASLSRGGMISLAAALIFLIVMSARLPKPATDNRELTASTSGAKRGFADLLYGFRRITGPRPPSRTFSVFAIAGAITVGLMWVGPDPVVSRINRLADADSGNVSAQQTQLASRLIVWRDTLSMIRANPLMGVGLGAYETAFPIFTKSDGSIRVPQAHNDYLQIVADCGVAGGLIMLWFLVLTFRAVWRGVRSRDPLMSGLALGSGGSIFAILVHSLFDFNLQLPSTALLFLVLSAVLARVSASVADAEGSRLQAPLPAPQMRRQEGALAAKVARGLQS